MFCRYRTDYSTFEECAKANVEHRSLQMKNLIECQNSLKLFMKRKEGHGMYMNEGLLKTYPTDKFTQQLMKCLHEVLECNLCICNGTIADQSDLVMFDGAEITICNSRIANDIVEDDNFVAMIQPDYNDVQNFIAGLVTYDIALDRINSKDKPTRDLIVNCINVKNLDKLIRCAYYCGYNYISHSIEYDKSGICHLLIAFEAKFHDKDIQIEDKLYHIAPLSLKDKILASGIVPKSKSQIGNIKLNHPDRVYLFNGYNEDVFAKYVMQHDKKSKKFKHRTNELYDCDDFAVFEIDKTKLQNMHFYKDDLYMSIDKKHPTAIFTYDTIAPKAITFKKTLSRRKKKHEDSL